MKYTRFLAHRIKNYLDYWDELVIRFHEQSIHERSQTSKRETTQHSAAKLEASKRPDTHSGHRLPALSSLKEGCRKPFYCRTEREKAMNGSRERTECDAVSSRCKGPSDGNDVIQDGGARSELTTFLREREIIRAQELCVSGGWPSWAPRP